MRRAFRITPVVTLLCVAAVQGQEPEPRLVIGGEGGAAASAFGRIADVAVAGDGGIFVLDVQSLAIRWFGEDGVLRGSVAGSGPAPGQLRGPQHIETTSRGTVLALDPLNGRISEYRAGDTGLIHVRDVRSPPALDFCVLGDRIYLLRLQADSVITVLDGRGAVTGAWGSLIEPEPGHDLPPDELRIEMDNQARVLCEPGTGTITVLYDRLPLVRRFDRRGEEIWRTELEDYHRVQDVRTPDESEWMIAPDPATGTAHTARAIAAGADGTLVLTLYEGSADGGRFEARILSAETGEELSRAVSPMVIVSAGDRFITGYVNAPVPRILRYDAGAIAGGPGGRDHRP